MVKKKELHMPATELLTEALTFARQRMLPIEES
jgi:hypothetical protein